MQNRRSNLLLRWAAERAVPVRDNVRTPTIMNHHGAIWIAVAFLPLALPASAQQRPTRRANRQVPMVTYYGTYSIDEAAHTITSYSIAVASRRGKASIASPLWRPPAAA